MNDAQPSNDKMESILRQFRATPADAQLRQGIADSLGHQVTQAQQKSWSDRLFQATVSLGATAALLIAAMLSLDFMDAQDRVPAMPQTADAPPQLQAADIRAALAAGRDPFMPQAAAPH